LARASARLCCRQPDASTRVVARDTLRPQADCLALQCCRLVVTPQNGYLVDEAGIHHLVLPAVVETPPGRDACGVVHVHTDRLELRGCDTCMTAICKLKPAAVQRQRAAAEAAAAEQLEQQQQPGGASSSGSGPASDAVVDVADDGGRDGVAAKAAEAAAAALASVSLSGQA
jgi:hypothetical protein